MDVTVPAGLVELSKLASENWALNPRGPRIAAGVVLGGPVETFTNGSGQRQIASFSVPVTDVDDERDQTAIQAANTAFAVECVRFVRQLIASSEPGATCKDCGGTGRGGPNTTDGSQDDDCCTCSGEGTV